MNPTSSPGPRAARPTSALVFLAAAAACAEADVQPPASFEMNGVIEGFYSTPWSHQDRIDMLRFMGDVGLRAYFYAPKDDPYHRSLWKDPYPTAEAERLRELVTTASEAGVEFWYAISPGLSMTYSSQDDYQALTEKIAQVSALGVRHFGLFVDDVPTTLTHEADRTAFGTLAAAHVDLTRRLHTDLNAQGSSLALTPTTYTGAWGDLDYVAEIGAGVPTEVPIFWTGTDVASPTITRRQADEWGRLLQRKPLVWDNYPVNDYARWRLFLGPFIGRSPDLPQSVSGIIANPMNEAHASMIALATLADYVRDPAAYDPERSLADALSRLFGPHAVALDPFLEVYGDYGWDDNVFEPLYFLRDTIALGPIEAALDRLDSAATMIQIRADSGVASLRTIVAELEPFVTQHRERVAQLRAQPIYMERGDTLTYRAGLDRFGSTPSTEPVVVDGSLLEWLGAEWFSLFESFNQAGTSSIAIQTDSANAYIAFDIRVPNVRVQPGARVGEADHMALVIDADPTDGRISPDDLYILLSPPTDNEADPIVTSLRFEGFMAKWLADNRALTFTEFHLGTFGANPAAATAPMGAGVSYATRRTSDGYVAELALPHMSREQIHLSLTVTSTTGRKRVRSLSRRNYPANPATFAVIEGLVGSRE